MLKQCSKFDDLKPCLVSLSYTLPGHPFCMLDCDDDIQALMAVALSSRFNRINILVRECGSSDSCHPVNDASISSLSCVVSSSSYGVSGGDMEVDLVPSFYGHEKKVLKSDGWVYLIKEVGQNFVGGAVEFS